MDAAVRYGAEGATRAYGCTAVVDVLFAATTAAILISKGVRKIYPVSSLKGLEEAKFRIDNPLLIVESAAYGVRDDWLDNRPTAVLSLPVDETMDRDAILLSTSGTPVVRLCPSNSFFFGFVNFNATYESLLVERNVNIIVPDGIGSEDDICANQMRDRLNEIRCISLQTAANRIRSMSGVISSRFITSNDIKIATSIDTVDVAIRLVRNDGLIYFKKYLTL